MKYFCSVCQKDFSSYSGMWRHKHKQHYNKNIMPNNKKTNNKKTNNKNGTTNKNIGAEKISMRAMWI